VIPSLAPRRVDGPAPRDSAAYVRACVATRDYGRAENSLRTPEETDIAWFWAENPYVHWNRNIMALAVQKSLNTRQTARLFAMIHTTVSDSIIVGFAEKYRFRSWRPRTAIPLADQDENAETVGDPTWRPLLSVNHPEYPSGHGFWSTAVVASVAGFFGTTRVDWTLTTSKTAVPAVVKTERSYTNVLTLLNEIGNARVWGGLHWRGSIRDGASIGARVAAYVHFTQFRSVR
jgi:hypothetical protein